MNTTNTPTRTERITLAKALAVKNRLAGRLVQAQMAIETENSLLIGRRPTAVDIRAEYGRFAAIQAAIVALKAAIQRANLPILERIFELAELKTRLKFLTGLDTKHGAEPGYNGSEFVYDAVLQKPEVLEMIRRLEGETDGIQDELNHYNAVTTVEVATDLLDLAR